jgi:hypothetical protein
MEIVAEPRMNRGEVEALTALIEKRQPGRVLEWGGGGSTLYWPARFPEVEWVTIEHDQGWYDGLRARITENVTLLHLEVPDYCDVTATAVGRFDLIIVDGRERVRCLSNARNLLNAGGAVVLHDSSQRRWRPGWRFYRSARELAAPQKKRRGLVLFEQPRPAAKVFGVGLSKTGTVSLTAALQRLGYRVKHYPPLLGVIEAAERYDAVTDSPVALYVEVLDRLYPDARFVLTVRDEAGWLDSCRRHWAGRKPRAADWRWNRRAVYGIESFDAEVFRRVYRAHVERVQAYFAGRAGKLLVLDVCGGEGYEELCPFLGLPVLNEAFPRRNVGRRE